MNWGEMTDEQRSRVELRDARDRLIQASDTIEDLAYQTSDDWRDQETLAAIDKQLKRLLRRVMRLVEVY